MIVHRICKARYAPGAFSGEGGLKSSGRWHLRGTPIVYAAATLSLAAIELFVHLGRTDSRLALMRVEAVIPDNLRVDTVDPASAPERWNASPPISATMEMGSEWCASGRSVAMKVPSAVIRGEFNYLLNPSHPDFRRIKISNPEVFSFDPRMWK